jgi:hypothetical protein
MVVAGDFSGTWKLNPDKSDMGGGGGRAGQGGQGRQGGGAIDITMVIQQDGQNLDISQSMSRGN